jgi:hypothetical protein
MRPEINLCVVTIEYGRLIVFTRRDSAEVWWFRYGLTPCIGTLKIIASTGVFVRVVFALKRSIRSIPQTPCMILILI